MRPDISLKSLVFLFFLFFLVFFLVNLTCGREGKAEEETLGVFSQTTPNAPKSFHTTFHE